MENILLRGSNIDTVNSNVFEEFFNQFHSSKEEKQCKIIDLCIEDKKRTVHLIEELAK